MSQRRLIRRAAPAAPQARATRLALAGLALAVAVVVLPHDASTAMTPERGAPAVVPDAAPADGPFAVEVGGDVSTLGRTPVLAMPGERVPLGALPPGPGYRFRATAAAGSIVQTGPDGWEWVAPEQPGAYDVRIESAGGTQVELAAFVLQPYQGERSLNGYRIGAYQERPLRGDPAYERPRGLIEVTEANEDTWISPHFQLGQFLCKQPGGYPKYVLVQPRLITKLELLIDQLASRGIEVDTLHVMSAYRTPAYNAAIGNTTSYSRHAYGDAADVFVDLNGDGRMDDLDGDGRTSSTDARLIYDEVDRLSTDGRFLPLVGGLGLYGPKPHRGPFVHLDTRGHKARW